MPRSRQHHRLLPLLLLLLLWLHVEGFQQVYYKRQFSEARTVVGQFTNYTTSTIRCASLCSSVSCLAWSWDSAKGECLVYTYLEGLIQSASSTCSTYLPLHTFIPLRPAGVWSWFEAKVGCNSIWATMAYVSDATERLLLEKMLGSAYFVGLKKTWDNMWQDPSGTTVADPMWGPGYPTTEKCTMYESGLRDVDCFDKFALVVICIVTP